MLVSLDWIREFIDIKMPVEEAENTLTMLGLEVEGVEKAGDDYLLDVNVTPNRPDCLSILGIARELSAATGLPVKLPDCRIKEEKPSEFHIEILDEELCRRYAGRVVRGVTIGDSPDWIRERLEKCGIRSINNVVDITNYVLLEFGHPLHAFDLNTLKGQTIRVGTAGKDRMITTLDGVERALPEEALLIWDAKRPVAVAGVMGGAETEVTRATTDILIESAYFEPVSVRRTSKALGVKTESSYRFERGTDIAGLETALDRAARLVLETAGGKAESKVDAYPLKFALPSLTVSYAKVNRVLGTELKDDEILGLLKKLNLDIKKNGDSFVVTPPPSRPDLAMDADIIEEIARLYGYDKIPTEVPEAEISSSDISPARTFISTVKEMIRKGGFNEAISYSFMNAKYLDLLRIPGDDGRRRCVSIKNPLRQEDALLRTMLAPSLLEMFTYNFFRGAKDIRLFEASRTFEQTDELLPRERLKLGGVYSSEKAYTLWKEPSEGFYVVKGVIEALFANIKIEDYTFTPSDEPFLHPGKSADINVSGEKAGFVGVVSPDIIEKLDIKSGPEVLIFELDMERLMSYTSEEAIYRPIPKFPHIERDVALLLDQGVMASEIMSALRSYPSEYIEEVTLFDSYEGGKLPKGKKSLAFSIRYRSGERTLTDEEVEDLHQGLTEHLKEKTGAEVRVS
jgi:phenylalanyl-tRNA synthetase beta chain